MTRNYKTEIEILTEADASFLTGLTKRELLVSLIPKVERADGTVTYRRRDIVEFFGGIDD